jgi:glycosyltransferase involved in cell wall biosynthesis
VRAAVRAFPEIDFDVIGPGLEPADALDFPNVTLHGPLPISEFKEIAQSWDVGILPFRENRLTFSLDPIKYYQYLASGLKIVSADVHALRNRPLTSIYGGGVTLTQAIGEALERPLEEADAGTVLTFLERSTWQARWRATMEKVDALRAKAASGDAA